MAAIAAYRNLFRASKIAFEVLSAAREKIRSSFREMKGIDAADPSVQPAIQHAEEVASFLRQNVVQGKRDESGTYKLRIHEETERGDNDTVKVAGQTITIDGKKCCSS
ncbi:mitochondrial zinc maintenance protein [Ophiostoma piceae UAMH 11346]|uniref:Mitochondrial zinc maintenance protein 1, mitochondrial n=1 Tax=Ophiostoma piceae (strain UAMH 11346) TaxID=1262450 RepID=S3C1J2_OPHP1|nr:mitochondrial zinc maintenance protein [Ophiostoma piceae UAMH 11346]